MSGRHSSAGQERLLGSLQQHDSSASNPPPTMLGLRDDQPPSAPGGASSSSSGALRDPLCAAPGTPPHLKGAEPRSTSAECAANSRAVLLTIISCMGALLFGWHLGYSSPAYDDVRLEAGLTTSETDLVFSVVTLGAMGGALAAGKVADWIGRRKALMLAALPLSVGPVIFVSWVTFYGLMVGRIVTGAGVGYSSVLVPLYIAEISPSSLRGALGTVNQLCVAGGIFLVNLAGLPTLGHPHYWKLLMLFSVGPAVLLFLGLALFGVDTPSWLVGRGRREDAAAALRVLRGRNARTDLELDSLVADKEAEDASGAAGASFMEQLRRLGRKENTRPFVIGVMVVFLQQLSGINAVIFNSKALFEGADPPKDADGRVSESTSRKALVGAILANLVQVLFTLVASGLIEKRGRRFFLKLSGFGLCVVSAGLGVAYWSDAADAFKLVLVMAYLAFFSLGLGPITWLLLGEIFPSETRGLLVSLATVINWGSGFVITLSFTSMNNALTNAGTFFLYSGVALVGTLVVHLIVPETKGRSLEEVAQVFQGGWIWRDDGGAALRRTRGAAAAEERGTVTYA